MMFNKFILSKYLFFFCIFVFFLFIFVILLFWNKWDRPVDSLLFKKESYIEMVNILQEDNLKGVLERDSVSLKKEMKPDELKRVRSLMKKTGVTKISSRDNRIDFRFKRPIRDKYCDFYSYIIQSGSNLQNYDPRKKNIGILERYGQGWYLIADRIDCFNFSRTKLILRYLLDLYIIPIIYLVIFIGSGILYYKQKK